jgi:thiol-disulfide isomerase/thioredoxin
MSSNINTVLALTITLLMTAGCADNPTHEKGVQKMDFSTFEPILKKQNDTVYVVNFWATWCKPCVEELPEFEKINKDYKGKPVKVILVSLDFPRKHEELLLPFIAENNIQSQVIHLTEVNANKWINKVSQEWSGAIPATVIYRGESHFFVEGKMNYEKIKSQIEHKL